MSLIKGFKANKAIDTLLGCSSIHSLEAKEAVAKLKQIGAQAIPKLIHALGESPANSPIEQLLISMLDNRTLSHYVDGLANQDGRIIAGTMRILANSRQYDPNRLFELFDDPDIPKNVLVQILLAHQGKLSVKILLGMLNNVEKNIRLMILKVLDEVAQESHLNDLLRYANSPDLNIRFNIIKIISRFHTESVCDALLQAINDPNKNVRQAAIEGLGETSIPVPAKPLCQLLKDPDLTVQSKAIDALTKIKDPTTVKYLIDILQDESEYVRRAAVEVLNEVGDPSAIHDLLIAMRDKDWWVKVRAADALGSIGGPKVVDAVLELIKNKDEFLRRTAVEILNSIKDKRAVVHLAKALSDDDWWVRERAADALGQLGDKRVVPSLLKMIKTHPESAPVAIQSIASLNDKTAIKPLLQILSKSQDKWGKDILQALAILTDEEMLPLVKNALQQLTINSNTAFKDLANSTLKTIVAHIAGHDTNRRVDETVITEDKNSVIDLSNTTETSDIYTAHIIDAAKLKPDQVLAERYKIIRQVGKGAFGVVVLVKDMMVNEDIILKFLNPHMASDESVIQRFIHELRFARKITHENVIRIYDFITFGKSYAISMEYFSSHSLAYEIKTKRTRDHTRIKQIFCDICKAMAVAHNAGVVHRDLKPANILVGENNLVKVVDFGLAAAASQSDARLTKSGILVGTPTYMAPEQVRARTIDARTDIYSLGILMYEIFTGHPPYKGEDHMATLFKHVEGNAKPANQANPKISNELNAIIMKAIATNPDDRYQDITAMQHDLEYLLKKEAA